MSMNFINCICFSFVLIIFSFCSHQQKETPKPIQKPISKSRYTFSKEQSVDFTVATGGYLVLYDRSIAVDTFFSYCGAQVVGKDSLVYNRIRRDFKDADEFVKGVYYGDVKGLFLYDGRTTKELKLPNFNSYFSSFCVKGKDVYYWSFDSDFNVCASKFNLKTKKHTFKQTGIDAGTDFFGYFWQPVISKNRVAFKVDSDEYCQYDLNLKLIKKKVHMYQTNE